MCRCLCDEGDCCSMHLLLQPRAMQAQSIALLRAVIYHIYGGIYCTFSPVRVLAKLTLKCDCKEPVSTHENDRNKIKNTHTICFVNLKGCNISILLSGTPFLQGFKTIQISHRSNIMSKYTFFFQLFTECNWAFIVFYQRTLMGSITIIAKL